MRGNNDSQFDSRFDAAFQPGFEHAPSDAALYDAFAQLGSTDPDADVRAETAPYRVRPLIDRFVVALWIVGAALLVLGLGIVLSGNSLFAGSFTSAPSELLIALSQLSQWMVPIGLATLVGTLFLLAGRWERRR